jgi:hypothetical protein
MIRRVIEYLFPSTRRKRESSEAEREKWMREASQRWNEEWKRRRDEIDAENIIGARFMRIQSLRNRAKFHRASMRQRP